MKPLLSLFSIALLFCFATTAMAGGLTLNDAKKSGLVGEREDGLIAAVLPNPSPDVQALVNSTNNGRMAVYKDTSAKQNTPLETVRKIAAEKIISMTASGEYVQVNGQWVQKK